jgi:hypothetical protein
VPRALHRDGVWEKACSRCGRTFTHGWLFHFFCVRAEAFDGFDYRCRRCNYAYGIERRRREKAPMLAAQGGRCKICGITFSEELPPFMDHCHESGRVRGLLCPPCNTKLGKLEANAKWRAPAGWRTSAEVYLRGGRDELNAEAN